MPAFPPERNLLFAVLALHNELAKPDDVLSAMQAWALAKHRPLGELLVERGALDPEHRRLLDALIEVQLARHGNTAQSLATLDASSRARRLLAKVDDADVQASLAALPVAPRVDMTLDFQPAEAGVRYRVLRPHAEGGLGEVFVAEDEELHREVALKEIKREHASREDSRARFLLEAEVTGCLEHPGIVPVYGLGTYADGRPFYAMRFIKGDNLKAAIARFHGSTPLRFDSLEFRQLLGRFVDVCQAVAYAHSRGVIHRDLKPANIMLGPYGETLVVDWGLAKVVGREEAGDTAEVTLRPGSTLGSGSSETQAGTAIGTPAYMSPEQAEGRLDALGPASDVYSLGATLYCLMTGKAPASDQDLGEALRRVARGEIPPPRSVDSRVPRALEAICLRAMALQPGERYVSARALADDVEHWLGDETVSAYREPGLTRLARWGRRHKTKVAAAGTLLLAATVALSVGTVLLSQANRRIEEQRNLARDQRDLARENFETARRAVNTFLTEVDEERLLNQPGMEPVRERLLRSALTYYEDFLRQRADDPSLQRELADASRRAGEIIGQIGSRREARAHLGKAVELYEELVATAPEDLELRAALARSLLGRGYNETFDSAPKVGERTFLQALPLWEELTRTRPDSVEYARLTGRCQDLAGMSAAIGGNPEVGLPRSEQAVGLLEETVRRFPGDRESKRLLALALNNRGMMLRLAGEPEQSMKSLGRAVEINRMILAEEPGDVRALLDLGRALTNIGRNDVRMGQLTRAEGPLREAEGIAAELTRRSPDLSAGATLRVDIQELLGTLERLRGRARPARRFLEACLSNEAELERKESINDDNRETFGDAAWSLGCLEAQSGRPEPARAAFDHGQALFEQIVGANESDMDYRSRLSLLREDRVREGVPPAAVEPETLLRAIVTEREGRVEGAPDAPDRKYELARALTSLATILLDAGRLAESEAQVTRAMPLLAEVIAARPRALAYRQVQIEAMGSMARLASQRGETDTARRSAAEAVKIAEALAQEDPAYLFDVARSQALLAGLADDPEPVAARAVHALRRAVSCGYDFIERLRTAKELKLLRERDDFRKLEDELERSRGRLEAEPTSTK